MTSKLSSELADTTREILEDAAFIFTAPCSIAPPNDADLVIARVPVHGEVPADLLLAVPRSLGAEIAANLLGMEPDDPEATTKTGDAVGEILNMIAGSLSAKSAQEGIPWTFGTPEIETIADPRSVVAEGKSYDAVLLTETGDRIWAVLRTTPPPPPEPEK
jgi:chemotaxis protein CheY-P-specific phosphatase CheC